MKKSVLVVLLTVLCGACGKTPPPEAASVDRDITMRLEVRMEANDKIEDSQAASFTLKSGTRGGPELTLRADNGVELWFTRCRFDHGKMLFDAWGFSGFHPLSSKSGTKLSAWPYKAEQSPAFCIPMDGSVKLDCWLTHLRRVDSQVDSGLLMVYATLGISTD